MALADRVRNVDPALVASVALCEAVGLLSGALTADDISGWYRTLDQPAFTPPDWVFAPVWTTLYALMGVSLYLVYREREAAGWTRALALFGLQLALNFSWSLVFFGGRSPLGGLVVILALLVALVLTTAAFWTVNRRAALLLVPYLLWVAFAALLNVEIYRLN